MKYVMDEKDKQRERTEENKGKKKEQTTRSDNSRPS